MKIFTDANDYKKSEKVLKWVFDKLGIKGDSPSIDKYHKGGYVCSFSVEETSPSWEVVVIQTLQKAQIVGRSWSISGNIEIELDLWSNESTVSGVTSLQVSVCKNA